MKTQSWLTLAGVIAVCATVVFAVTKLQDTGITIQNSGSSAAVIQNSLSVSGEGKATAAPDIVRINAGVSELGDTTKEAQEMANQKVEAIINILKENDVPENNVQTSNLSFYPEYEWKDEEGRKLMGQRVRQTLTIKIPEIDKNPERATEILDALGEINGLELNSVNFDIEDKEELFSKAREEAFKKAHQKAKELADFGGVDLGKPITITDSNIQYRPMAYENIAYAKDMAVGIGGGGSVLPSGELNVSATVSVVFEIK